MFLFCNSNCFWIRFRKNTKYRNTNFTNFFYGIHTSFCGFYVIFVKMLTKVLRQKRNIPFGGIHIQHFMYEKYCIFVREFFQ